MITIFQKHLIFFRYFLLMLLFGVGMHLNEIHAQVDHYETIIFDHDDWNYFEGVSEPPINWNAMSFDASGWATGKGGFGYGDGDDQTIVGKSAPSVYIRHEFNVDFLQPIEKLLLHVDFDDAFVAYLNGTEIARVGIGVAGVPPSHNDFATIDHEASLFMNIPPEFISVDQGLLNQGANVFAVQVHNVNSASSDLTIRAFLSAGINNNLTYFRPVPDWFTAPLEDLGSNLPLIKINTFGQSIVDEPRIVAEMGIIDNGPNSRNKLSDPFNDFSGRIEIEIRGSSSKMFPKKNYRFETQDFSGLNLDVSLLGMPPENDWVIHGPYSDKSLMRNVLMFHIGELMGNYTPRTRFAELVINEDYQGVVVLMETIKKDSNRVDLADLNAIDLSGNELTGGYIFKVDRNDLYAGGWTGTFTTAGNYAPYQLVYPKPEYVQTLQFNYIVDFVKDFEREIFQGFMNNPTFGFPLRADINSFVDFLIANEISNNVDGYRLSTFFHKDKDSRGGKLKAGPLWDFNLAFGNADYCEGWSETVWAYRFNDRCGPNVPFYWEKMMNSVLFASVLKSRWQNLRSGALSNENLLNWIDSVANVLDEAQSRNFQRWGTLGNYVWPNYFIGPTYESEIQYLKGWLVRRLDFLDRAIPAHKPTSYQPDLFNVKTEVYPNPFMDQVSVRFAVVQKDIIRIVLYNTKGQAVKEINAGEIDFGVYSMDINTQELPPGFYLLSLEGLKNDFESKRLVKYP